jgi:predicted phosphodiesterase
MNKAQKNAIIVGIIIAAVSVVGYRVFFSSEKKKAENKSQQESVSDETLLVGWTTDVHCGKEKKLKIEDKNVVYPARACENFPEALKRMKDQGAEIVVDTGDISNSGDQESIDRMEKAAEEIGVKLLVSWGNHDGGRYENYFVDRKGWRLVIIGDLNGTMTDEQAIWLENALQTEKKKLVAIHVPIYLYKTWEIQNTRLEEILSKNKVNLVLSGHWHHAWERDLNGVRYMGGTALTLNDKNAINFQILKL